MSTTFRPFHIQTELVKRGKFTFLFLANSLFDSPARMAVKGSINDQPFTAYANPWRYNRHVVMINKALRERLNLRGGELVDLYLEPDLSGGTEVEVARDIQARRIAGMVAELKKKLQKGDKSKE